MTPAAALYRPHSVPWLFRTVCFAPTPHQPGDAPMGLVDATASLDQAAWRVAPTRPPAGGAAVGDPIAARAFVVGCARSGTTLLQCLLGAHPRILTFPESHVLYHAVELPEAAPAALARFARQAGLTDLPETPPTPDWTPRDYAHALAALLDDATRRQGKDIWLEKTPLHLHYIEQIAAALPDARFLHVVRDGLATVASLYGVTTAYPDHWAGRRTLQRCAARWVADVRRSLRAAEQPGHHLVRYENLVAAPHHILRAACAFLGVEYALRMVGGHRAVARRVILPHETWKARVRDDIALAPARRSPILALSDDERRFVQEQVGATQALLDTAVPLWAADVGRRESAPCG